MCQGAAISKKRRVPVRGFSWRPFFVFAGEGQVDGRGSEEEDDGYQAFGEDGEGESCPHEVGMGGRRDAVRAFARITHPSQRREGWATRSCAGAILEGSQEAVEGCAEEEREQDFGDEVAGEEEDSGGGEDGEAGVEGGAGVEGLFSPEVAEQSEEEDCDGLWEMGGEGVEAEDAEAEGDEPVGEGRLFRGSGRHRHGG